ncbi:MAG TPA: ferredoxin, partial [Sarcina sp.]|nr:ferredoxin [Sarcina sp.]
PEETGSGSPVVYFSSDISAEGLVNIYDALGWTPAGKTAVKISTGEPPASNYLRPELIEDLVKKVDGTIVECNTAYGGSRSSSAMHRQVAEDHGFTAIADFDLMDEEGEVEWPVTGGSRLDKIIVGSHAQNYPDWVILSHFKGHAMAGFGGAIKNVGIGISSSSGKVYVHSAGTRTSGSIMNSDQDAWLEALAEMVTGFRDHVGEDHIIYINVMNRLSVDCDCDGNPAEPDMHDIGILASRDPVALDQACLDLVYQAEDSASLVERIESRHGIHTLEHAEEIGLGSRSYELVNIDE